LSRLEFFKDIARLVRQILGINVLLQQAGLNFPQSRCNGSAASAGGGEGALIASDNAQGFFIIALFLI